MKKSNTLRGGPFVDQILRTSERAVIENGFSHVKIQHITEGAGCSRTKLFQYFGTRDEVLKLIIEDNMSIIYADIRSQLDIDRSWEENLQILLKYRSLEISRNHVLSRYFRDRLTFAKKLSSFDLTVAKREDRILTGLLCDLYGTAPGSITPMGLDYGQIWELLWPYDERNKLLGQKTC